MIDAIIIGAGTYGQIYAEYLQETGFYNILGFLDDDLSKQKKSINGLKVIGLIQELEHFKSLNQLAVFCPIGNNNLRFEILNKALNLGFLTPSFIHSSVEIHKSVKYGCCFYVLPQTNIMPFVQIGDFVMVSMGVNIAHHNIIGSRSFLSQGVNIGANIKIGENSFIGIGSTIVTGVKNIGNNVTVGAGAVVINSIPDSVVVAGVPAKALKSKSF
jgi:sugar O-acyltransferase (sialic acid O-acetyltransferase NeuD family)